MDGSIDLTVEERKILLTAYRSSGDARMARRAHVLLLRHDGLSYREIRRVAYVSFDFITACIQRFQGGRVQAVLGHEPDEPETVPFWLLHMAAWVSQRTPQDFGYFRTRWSCELLAEVLAWETGLRLSPETVRRGLHRLGFAWRRPRPVLGPTDPEYAGKLGRIQQLLAGLPRHETAVFQDEVDVHLNPKIGPMWMRKGAQAEVVTPGNNVKRHLAGSLHWRTRRLIVSAPGDRRNSQLFVDHLRHLAHALRRFRKIHVICDNAAFHTSRKVQQFLSSAGQRIRLHFLPKYAPETNPIERAWWHLHETITRNHRCQTIEELLDNVSEWISQKRHFEIETSLYERQAA